MTACLWVIRVRVDKGANAPFLLYHVPVRLEHYSGSDIATLQPRNEFSYRCDEQQCAHV